MLFAYLRPQIGYVYVLRDEHGLYKIGCTASDLRTRLTLVGGECDRAVSFCRAIVSECPKLLERRLHDRFREVAVGHEWFRLCPADAEWLITATPDQMRRYVPETARWYSPNESQAVYENLTHRFYRTMGPSGVGGRFADMMHDFWSSETTAALGVPTDTFRDR